MPLGNREGEWSPEARRPRRSCHHEALGGGLVACPAALSALGHRPSSEFRKVGMIFFSSRRVRHRPVALLVSIVAGAAVGGAACRSAPARDARISVVDDAGDTVGLAAPARRVVSLIPATTELLFAIGADSAVVGRTRYCDYPPAAKAVPDLGDGIKPNI